MGQTAYDRVGSNFNSRPRGRAVARPSSWHCRYQYFNSRPRGKAILSEEEEDEKNDYFNSRPRGKAIRKNGHNTSSIFPYLPQSVVIKAGRTQKSRYLTWNMRAKNARYLRVPTRNFCAGKVRAFRESRVVQPPPWRYGPAYRFCSDSDCPSGKSVCYPFQDPSSAAIRF